jgi:long-subunit fatty acid transport protein
LTDIGKTDFLYEGSGGLNKAFIGNSFKIFKNFSLGFNASYLFGAMVKTRSVSFPDSIAFFNYKIKNNTNVSDFTFNYGLQYVIPIKKVNSLTVGLTFSNSQKINATKDELGIRFVPQSGGGITVKDTINFTTNLSGNIVIPTCFGGGLVFKKTEHLLIGADVNWQNWSKYSSFGEVDSLKNSMDFAIGGQFIPTSTNASGYFKKIAYRIGVRYGQSYLQLKNSQLTEYAISFGFTFPLKKTRSTINLAFELGEMGTYENNLHKEQFGRVMLTFNIKERWFIKPKFD